jgi:hypothetical protein
VFSKTVRVFPVSAAFPQIPTHLSRGSVMVPVPVFDSTESLSEEDFSVDSVLNSKVVPESGRYSVFLRLPSDHVSFTLLSALIDDSDLSVVQL